MAWALPTAQGPGGAWNLHPWFPVRWSWKQELSPEMGLIIFTAGVRAPVPIQQP